MIGIALDVIIIIAMQAMLEGMSDEWTELILPVLAITICNVIIVLLLGPVVGYLVVVPMAAVTVGILMLLCHMSLRNALITAGVMVVGKIGLMMLFTR